MSDELTIGSLCTGYGGLDDAVNAVFGGEIVWWSDIEPTVAETRYPNAPNLGDLKLVDWSAVQPVKILTAGYPCQPFSNAGKRLGTEDPRHLWPWISRAIGVLRPQIIVLENVAAHLRRGFDVVSADLAGLGYDTAWTVVRASDVGAPHQRRRLFILAWDASKLGRCETPTAPECSEPEGPVGRPDCDVADPEGDGRDQGGGRINGARQAI